MDAASEASPARSTDSRAASARSGSLKPVEIEEPDPRQALFNTEEQQYRALYGAAAFYAAKQEQAQEMAGTVMH